ncbi:MAG: hypothetical protein FK734_10845 [Asgard group archaeon]|nr:hypothetical protein [Asgard group archaeon]
MLRRRRASRIAKEINVKPRRSHVISVFLSLEALSEESSCLVSQLGLDLELYKSLINELIDSKIIIVIHKKNEEFFYLDLDKYKAVKEQEDKRLFMILVSIVIPAIWFLLLGLAWLIS